MKRFLAIFIVLTMLIGVVPVFGASTSNVLYDIDEFSEFPKTVRIDASEVKGFAGRNADDSSAKFVFNTEERANKYNGYFDLNWGSVSNGAWTKSDYKGYLVTRFSVYSNVETTYLGLYTDGNANVSGNLNGLVNIDKWNKVVVITDRTGGANNGKTCTYINGELAVDWTKDSLGLAHGTNSFKFHLRFFAEAPKGSAVYMDDVSVTETDEMPDITDEEPPVIPEEPPVIPEEPPVTGDVITPVESDLSMFSANKIAVETINVSKYGRQDIRCTHVTDNNTASDAFFQKSWTPKNNASRYLVLNINFVANDKMDRFYIGTNQNSAMSGTAYNNIHFSPYRWNRYTMVYDIVANTSDAYINGEKVFEKTSGKYTIGTSNCIRILMLGEGLEAYMDGLDVYECIEYPEIASIVRPEDCFDTEKGIHVDNATGVINAMGNKTVSDVKSLFVDDVKVYRDDTYSELLAENEVLPAGAVVFAESDDSIYTYYNVGVYENNTLSLYSENYSGKYNTLVNNSVNVIAPVTDGGVLATAQYGADGSLVKLQIASATGETCISNVFAPECIDNSVIKSFLWQSGNNIIPLSKTSETEYTTGTTVCFLGDSITQKGKFIEEVYEYWCTDESAKPGLRMFNCGIPGDKTSDALARIDEDCLSYDPDVTFVMLGTNDMNKNYFPIDNTKFASLESGRNELYATYKANMISIIERLIAYGSKVILIAPVPYDDVTDGTTQRNVGIEKCGEIVKELAEQYNLDYIDMYGFMKDLKWSDYYYPDMTHPSEKGHHVMAQIILKHYGCVETVDTGDYIRDFTSVNALRYNQSYNYRFVKHIDYSAGFKGKSLAEKKAKALETINSTTDDHTKWRYTLYYDNIETIDKMNEELIRLTIETSVKNW